MADAILVSIAGDCVTRLTDAGLSQSFTPVLSYLPHYTAEQAKELSVRVIPAGFMPRRIGRSLDACQYAIHIGVIKQVKTNAGALDETAVNDMLVLVNDIYLVFKRFKAATSGASCIEITNNPAYDVVDLKAGVFLSILGLTFQVQQ